MKDRLRRTGHQKANHRLVKVTGCVLTLSLVFASVLTAGIIYFASGNYKVSQSIHHYGEKIDYIENETKMAESRYRQRT